MSETSNIRRSTRKSSLGTSAILDQDISNVDKEYEDGWWDGLGSLWKNKGTYLKSLLYGNARDNSRMTINSTGIQGDLSAEVEKHNILETSESEKEVEIKKRKAPLKLANRESKSNHFLSILDFEDDTTILSEFDSKLHKRKTRSSVSNRNSSSKIIEEKEDSEDSSVLSNVPLKLRVKFAGKRASKETRTSNIFEDKLQNETSANLENYAVLHEFDKLHQDHRSKSSSNKNISPKKSEEEKEDSNNSILRSNVPTKSRVKFTRSRTSKGISNFFEDELQDKTSNNINESFKPTAHSTIRTINLDENVDSEDSTPLNNIPLKSKIKFARKRVSKETSNIFEDKLEGEPSVLNSEDHAILNESDDKLQKRKKLNSSSENISPKLKGANKDSNDSTLLSNTSSKSRIKFTRNRTSKETSNIFEDELKDKSNNFDYAIRTPFKPKARPSIRTINSPTDDSNLKEKEDREKSTSLSNTPLKSRVKFTKNRTSEQTTNIFQDNLLDKTSESDVEDHTSNELDDELYKHKESSKFSSNNISPKELQRTRKDRDDSTLLNDTPSKSRINTKRTSKETSNIFEDVLQDKRSESGLEDHTLNELESELYKHKESSKFSSNNISPKELQRTRKDRDDSTLLNDTPSKSRINTKRTSKETSNIFEDVLQDKRSESDLEDHTLNELESELYKHKESSKFSSNNISPKELQRARKNRDDSTLLNDTSSKSRINTKRTSKETSNIFQDVLQDKASRSDFEDHTSIELESELHKHKESSESSSKNISSKKLEGAKEDREDSTSLSNVPSTSRVMFTSNKTPKRTSNTLEDNLQDKTSGLNFEDHTSSESEFEFHKHKEVSRSSSKNISPKELEGTRKNSNDSTLLNNTPSKSRRKLTKRTSKETSNIFEDELEDKSSNFNSAVKTSRISEAQPTVRTTKLDESHANNSNLSLHHKDSSSHSLSKRTSLITDGKAVENDANKVNNRTINDFFKAKRSLTGKEGVATSSNQNLASEIFKDAEKMRKINEQLEELKTRKMAMMKIHPDKTNKKQSTLKVNAINTVLTGIMKKKKSSVESAKKVDPAYLVNGKVYKVPRLPRPKSWATNRLYKFLWKQMEPKYSMSTRVRSEKFVLEFSKVVTLIMRRKKYSNYELELRGLMKEMARLQIIKTRNDFYDFCHDFMPYEFRAKVIPILLPGNKHSIPFNPTELYTPLLEE